MYIYIHRIYRVFANGPGDQVQSQVGSNQRLKKWYAVPTCSTLIILRFGSRVKWSNPENGVAPSPTPRCCSYQKGCLRVTVDYSRQLYYIHIYIYTHVYFCVYIYIRNYVRARALTHTNKYIYIILCKNRNKKYTSLESL